MRELRPNAISYIPHRLAGYILSELVSCKAFNSPEQSIHGFDLRPELRAWYVRPFSSWYFKILDRNDAVDSIGCWAERLDY
jgi:hypothetical protein